MKVFGEIIITEDTRQAVSAYSKRFVQHTKDSDFIRFIHSHVKMIAPGEVFRYPEERSLICTAVHVSFTVLSGECVVGMDSLLPNRNGTVIYKPIR